MFEYHGWVTLHATPDDDEPPLPLDEIRGLPHGRLDQINGQWFVHLGGFRNHRDGTVVDTFAEIGRLAPGSYGLLHVRDDEDPGRENEVRVHRLVRGVVTEHTEPLLSPCIPTVEDELTH